MNGQCWKTILLAVLVVGAASLRIEIFSPSGCNADLAVLSSLPTLPVPSTIPSSNVADTLDPWGTDQDRACLPIGVFPKTDVVFGVVNASVCGVSSPVSQVSEWDPSQGTENGTLGVLVGPLPALEAGRVCDVSVGVHLDSGADAVKNAADAVRYQVLDALSRGNMEKLPSIGSVSGASKAIVLGHLRGLSNTTELLVADTTYDNGNGAAFVLSISPAGVETLNWFQETREAFGFGLLLVGDVDEDGSPFEVVVAELNNRQMGQLHLYSLAPDGKETKLGFRGSNGVDLYGRQGMGMALLGDLNGDGRPVEIAVGVPRQDDGGDDRGVIFLFSFSASGSFQFLSSMGQGTLEDANFPTPGHFGYSMAQVPTIGLNYDASLIVGGSREIYSISFDLDGTGIIHDAMSTNQDQADELVYLPFDLNFDGLANEVIVGLPSSSLVANSNGLLLVYSWTSDGTLVVEREIGSTFSHYNGRLGRSLAFLGDIRMTGVARSLFVFYDDTSSPRPIGFIADILDTSDRSGPAYIVGMADPLSSSLELEISSPSAKLRYLAHAVDLAFEQPKGIVDSEGKDVERSTLPVSIVIPAEPCSLSFAAVDGRLCEDVQWAQGWPEPTDPSHFNPRHRGVYCVGTPPGNPGTRAKVAVGFRSEEHQKEQQYTILESMYSLAQYDNPWSRNSSLQLVTSSLIEGAQVITLAGYIFNDATSSKRVVLVYAAGDQLSVAFLDPSSHALDHSLPSPNSITVAGIVTSIATLGFVEREGFRGLFNTPTDAVVLAGVSSLDQLFIVRFPLYLTNHVATADPLPSSMGPVQLMGVNATECGVAEVGASISILYPPSSPIESSANDSSRAVILGAPASDSGTGALLLVHMNVSQTWTDGNYAKLMIQDSIAGDRVGHSVASVGDRHLAVALVASEQVVIVAIPESLLEQGLLASGNGGGSHFLQSLQRLSASPSSLVRPWGTPLSGDGLCMGFFVAAEDTVNVFEMVGTLAGNDTMGQVAEHLWSGTLPSDGEVQDVLGLGELGEPESNRQLAVIDATTAHLFKLPTVPRITRADTITAINVVSSTRQQPCNHACRISYLRGGDLAGDSHIEMHLFFTYHLDPSVVRVAAMSIGGVPCARAELRGWKHVDANLFRAIVHCSTLRMPTSLIPPVITSGEGSAVILSGASVQLQVRRNATLWSRDPISRTVVEVPPDTLLFPIETRNAKMYVFVAVSERMIPTVNETEWLPDTLEPHTPFPVAIHLSNMLIASDPDDVDLDVWSTGDVNVVEYRTSSFLPSDSYHNLVFLSMSATVCVAGRTSASIFVGTLQNSMVVEQHLPPFAPLELDYTQGPHINSLSVLGGTSIDIVGRGFGNGNLSDPLSNVVALCTASWDTAGLATGRPDPDADPRLSVFWAFVGGVPCVDTVWISPTRMKCIAPPGIGQNVSVAVVVEGRTARLPYAVSYQDVNPVESIETESGPTLSVGGGQLVNVSMPFARILLESPVARAIRIKAIRIGPFLQPFSELWFPLTFSHESAFYLADLPVPAGVGGNHSVAICFLEEASVAFFAAQLWNEPPQESCSTVANAAVAHYNPPLVSTSSPSADLNAFGEDRLILRGENFGDPELLQAHAIELSVSLSGVQCLAVLHVSTDEIRCTTQRLPDSLFTVQLTVTVADQTSNPVSISIVRVSLNSISPRNVQPAAPGMLYYDFVVSVLRPEEVGSVMIAGIHCPDPIVIGTESLLCENIEAPTKWITDDAWVVSKRDAEVLSRSAVLRAQPPPAIVALSTPQGVPTTGNVSMIIAGEGFGIGAPDFGGVVVGGTETIATETWKGDRPSNAFVSPSSHAIFLPSAYGVISPDSTMSTWLGPNKIQLTLPRGQGRNVPVRVATTWGLLSAPTFISFDPPTPTHISPSTIRPGIVAAPLQICGQSFPPVGSSSTSVIVGGQPCFSIQLVSDTCLRCFVNTPGVGGLEQWEDEVVTVSVEGIEGPPTANLATFLPLPVLLNSNRETVSFGATVRLTGSGFSADPEYVVAVIVGGDESTAMSVFQGDSGYTGKYASANVSILVEDSLLYIDETQVSFEMPNGAGTDIAVRVGTLTGLVSSPIFVSYQTPTALSIEPTVFLPGQGNISVVLTGSDFPSLPLFVDFFKIGGVDCPPEMISTLSTSVIQCESLSTPTSSDWASMTVEISIAGESISMASVEMEFVGAPVVNGILESSAGEGDTVTIIGRNFGARPSDVKAVRIGGELCEDLQWHSSTEIKCMIPDPHPLWRAALAGDLVVPAVELEVELVTGIVSTGTPPTSSSPSSSSPTTPSFTPSGLRLRPRPTLKPTGVTAWRFAGRSNAIIVRWRYPGPSLESIQNNLVEAATKPALGTAFRVEALLVTPNGSISLDGGIATASAAVVERSTKIRSALDIASEMSSGAWEWFQFSLPVASSAPHVVRVRVENDDGSGPWVFIRNETSTAPLWPDRGQAASDPQILVANTLKNLNLTLTDSIPDSCTRDEYLSTNKVNTPDQVKCEPCPAGAMCAGLSAENVSAVDGHWRVPWSQDSLGFARCPTPVACIGAAQNYVDRVRARATITTLPENATTWQEWVFADNQDRDLSVPNASLVPSRLEKCRIGHGGILCASCLEGYYVDADNLCVSCGGFVWTAVRAFLFLLGVMLLFSLLLVRAWKSRSQSSSKPVQVVKILVTHIQIISIIGAVQLRWPQEVRGMFSGVSSTSSFATSGFAFDCLLGDNVHNPYLRTLVVYLLPIILLSYAFVFWSILTLAERCCRPINRCLSDSNSSSPSSTHFTSESPVQATTGSARTSPSVAVSEFERQPKHGDQETETEQLSKVRLGFWSVFKKRMYISLVVIMFLSHTPMSLAAFRLVTCRPVSPLDDPSNSKYFLSMNMDISCQDIDVFGGLLAMSLPVIVLVSFGVPIAFAQYLRSIGSTNLKKPEWRGFLGFLYTGYRDNFYFWESVNLFRKVLIALVSTVFAPIGPSFQLFSAILVILIAQVVHARSQPFLSRLINSVESLSMVAAEVTLLTGLFIIANESEDAESKTSQVVQITASIIIISVNAFFFIVVLSLFSSRARQFFGERYAHLCQHCALRNSNASTQPTHSAGHTTDAGWHTGWVGNPLAASQDRTRMFSSNLYRHHAVKSRLHKPSQAKE